MEGGEDPEAQILHTVANPIRKNAIRALAQQKMRFSQLMSACGLDYDHDAGHFNYHLSDLIEKGNPAVKRAIASLMQVAHRDGKTVSICGQAPSVYADFVEFLVRQGIDSISVSPDIVEAKKWEVAAIEKRILLESVLAGAGRCK